MSCWRTSAISRHASPRLSTPQVQGPEPGPRVWGGLSPCLLTLVCLYPAGVATDAKVGSELIQVLALDADIGNSSLVFYGILAIHYFRPWPMTLRTWARSCDR